MIAGHLGVALAARSLRHDARLVWLLAAAIAPDLADGVFALVKFCSPNGTYSHSIPASVVLAGMAAGSTLILTRNRGAAAVVGTVVLSHLPLDLITGEKVLWPGGFVHGLYLYRFPIWDFVVELPVVVVGWLLLRRSGDGPRWAMSVATVVALLLLQAAADLAKSYPVPMLQSACEVPAASPATN